ncbi:MAG: hypothetical protein ACI4TE_07905 [Alphaproteobacteria bacterium]
MKKKLQKWLLLFFFISFCATSALTYVAQTKQAERTAVLTISARVDHLRHEIDTHEKDMVSLSKEIEQILEEKAAALALSLKNDPGLAKDHSFLNAWRKNNELEDLQIISPNPSETFFFFRNTAGTTVTELCQSAFIGIFFPDRRTGVQ